MSDTTELAGVELPVTGGSDAKPRAVRGFAANPEALRRAVETRARNKGLRQAVSLPGSDEGDAAPAVPRGPGRPSGSSKRDRNLQGMEQMLLAMHMMVATATGFPEMAIDAQESHILADALANLADHYKISIAGKPGAVLGLIYAAGTVYGPRAVAVFMKLRKEAKTDDGNPSSAT